MDNKSFIKSPDENKYLYVKRNWHARAWFIKSLRFLLPILALACAIALILWSGQDEVDTSVIAAQTQENQNQKIPHPDTWDNMLLVPRFTSRDDKGNPYTITATRALQDTGENAPILLEQPKASIEIDGADVVDASSVLGQYDTADRKLSLTQGVELSLNKGQYWLKTKEMSIDLAKQIAVSKTPVQGGGEKADIDAKGLIADMTNEVLTFNGKAITNLIQGNDRITITAQKAFVWNKKEQTFTATGNPIATNGQGSTINAKILKADYVNKEGGGIEITNLYANDNVVISNTNRNGSCARAYGDIANYNVKSGLGNLKGGDLRIEAQDGIILKAGDGFTYSAQKQQFTAQGGAIVTKPTGEKITAPHMAAQLHKSNDSGKVELKEITAWGGVVVMQGETVIKGARAKIDPKTGIATILGNKSENGRAKATLHPKGSGEKLPSF